MILNLVLLAKLLHILSVLALVAGLVGRDLVFAWAGRTAEFAVVAALLQLSERFERLLVRPGSELVFLFGLITAWLERQPLLSVLGGARPAWAFVGLVAYSLTIPLVFLALVPGTRRRRLAIGAALARQGMTADLDAALHDRSVLVTRRIELLMILVVLILMVLKPF
ncbi:MAG TPA: DUF2269 family protein [Anaerolineae bacterium]